jgi:hypothetical protein
MGNEHEPVILLLCANAIVLQGRRMRFVPHRTLRACLIHNIEKLVHHGYGL